MGMTPQNLYDLVYAYIKVVARKPSVLAYLASLPAVYYTFERFLSGLPSL